MKTTPALLISVLYSLLSFAQPTLVPFGSAWKYLDDGSDQGDAWRSRSFIDDDWKTGLAEFGYGDKDEATVVSYGNNKRKKYITTYFRKAIIIDDISQLADFTGNIKRDDGAVVYINGTEVYRSNMPSGDILYNTLASQGANNDDGNTVHTFHVNNSVFIDGVNTIAAEIHQSNANSSDISFDMALEVTLNPGPGQDSTPPNVQSILRQSPSEATTTASSLVFRVSFSEVVSGVDASDFILTVTAGALSSSIVSVANVNNNASIYDITIGSISGAGTLRLDIKNTGTSISDPAGNLLANGYSAGETYSISQVVPPQPSTSLTRGPYLQMASQSAVTLRWRTSTATDSKIEAGTSINSYPLSGHNAAVTTEHEVRISGLTAGTKYFYRFGSSSKVLQGGSDNYFVTAPPANSSKKIRIAAFGDCGNLNSVQTSVLNAYLNYTTSSRAELMLLLGDNAYEDGTDAEYQTKFFQPYGTTVLKNHVLFPTPGNHDYHTTTQAARTAPYYQNFSVPTQGECGGVASGTKSFYSYNWGNVHFLSLDSYGQESDGTRLYDTLGPQVNWVKRDLEANSSKWTIAFWHHPPFTKGSHDSDAEGELRETRENFIRILERYGVDLILCGHSHVYERSYLLKGYYGTESTFNQSVHTVTTSSGKYDGSSNSCPYVTKDGKFNHGTVYVVSGSSARSGSDVSSSFPHDALPFATRDGGMFYFEVEDNRLDAKFINEHGAVFDQFTLLKEVNKTQTVSIADGEAVTLTASWIGEYDWSNGATTRSITVAPNNNITYTVTDNKNCLRDEFNISVGIVTTALRSANEARSADSEISSLQIFPTIVKKGIAVTMQLKTPDVVAADILDNNGRVIRRLKLSGTSFIGTSDLPAGMYFIIVNSRRNSKMKFIVTD